MVAKVLIVLGASFILAPALTWAPANAYDSPLKQSVSTQESVGTPHMGLTVENGVLYHDGHPFKGIGVDYFNLFYAHLLNPTNTSYVSGLQQLEKHHIPFVRFMATGYWPDNLKLYETNPDKYWNLMGDIVHQAQKDHVGLIPDFFWTTFAIPDLVGEPVDQWGNPNSKTIRFAKQYVKEFIQHFGNSPAIWGYEFGNEWNLSTDLPNAAQNLPPIEPQLGTPSVRTSQDELTSTEVVSAFTQIAEEIRKYDPYRIIESGNGADRPSSWHQKYDDSWTVDSPTEYAQMMAYLNPAPFDMMSAHIYPGQSLLPFTTLGQYMTQLNQISNQNKEPLFVGEFGVSDPSGTPSTQTKQQFQSLLQAIVQSGTPLAALWVYNYSSQPTWNVTFDNARSYQLKAIEQADMLFAVTPPSPPSPRATKTSAKAAKKVAKVSAPLPIGPKPD